MAVTFVSRFHKNPFSQEDVGKFYPAVSYIAEISVSKLAQEISESTTLTPTEIVGVIQSFLITIPKYMMLGYKVRLDNFGLFKLGVNGTNGRPTAEAVSADDIKGLKVLFHPDAMLKARIQNPEFVKLDLRAKSDGSSHAGDGPQAGDGGSQAANPDPQAGDGGSQTANPDPQAGDGGNSAGPDQDSDFYS